MNRTRLILLLAVLGHSFLAPAQIRLDMGKLQKELQQGIAKAYQASVKIAEYDTLSQSAQVGNFSGVVVNAEGHVLSVAHAVKPGQAYELSFSNGKRCRAKGLGVIASKDMAMLQIIDKGTWPYAEMGWSGSLKPLVPCISISHPGSLMLYAQTPSIRFGYVVAMPADSNATSNEKFLQTTCLMEPGDSGGPVFDLYGRVIGLHSQIGLTLNENYEVPIDEYRRYWDLLLQAKKHKKKDLPAVQALAPDQLKATLLPFAELEKLDQLPALHQLSSRFAKDSFRLQSTIAGRKTSILAILVDLKGLLAEKFLKHRSYLLTKSSMLGSNATLIQGSGLPISLKVIKRDRANDLALIEVEKKIKGGILLQKVNRDTIRFADLGRLLLSPKANEGAIVSVLGNTPITIFPIVGLFADDSGQHIKIVTKDTISAIREAGLQAGDELLEINNLPLRSKTDLQKAVFGGETKDSIRIRFSRLGQVIDRYVVLQRIKLEMNSFHMAEFFEGGKSERRDGFNSVLVHDGRVQPEECGSPLFGLDGKFYGMNIARLSRTSTLAIPVAVLVDFVKEALTPAVKEK